MVRLVTDDDIGLKVLREAPAGAAQIIDIVAIHGIGAHPDESWCKNVGTAANAQWVNWLDKEDMLPAVAPHARIMRYGYQSQWFGEGALRQNASTVAQRLLLALKRKREEFKWRPLVFIAHCFGGLVVLKALVDARHDEDEWPGVFTSTTGLIFLGTPFRGTEGMKPVEMLEAARSQYQENEVQPAVLGILEPGNEFLQELVDQFGKTRMVASKAQVACFYELKSSNVGRIVGKENRTRFVVNRSSGCLDLSDATSAFSLSRTHFDMNKFGKPTEEDFEIVRDVVRKMVSAAHGAVIARYQERRNARIPTELLEPSSMVMPISNDLQTSRSSSGLTNDVLAPQASRNNGETIVKVPKSSSTWSPAEDEMLLNIVQTMGLPKWKHVAKHFSRDHWACQKRYEKLMRRRTNS
jgi:hypothetical protein